MWNINQILYFNNINNNNNRWTTDEILHCSKIDFKKAVKLKPLQCDQDKHAAHQSSNKWVWK